MRALDPAAPPYGIVTVEQHLTRTVALRRFQTMLLVALAAVALMLAIIGAYSDRASVGRRTHRKRHPLYLAGVGGAVGTTGAAPGAGACGGPPPRGGPKFVVTGSPLSSWKATFRLMSARDFGVPPVLEILQQLVLQEHGELRVLFELRQRLFRRLATRQGSLRGRQQCAMEFRVGAEALP